MAFLFFFVFGVGREESAELQMDFDWVFVFQEGTGRSPQAGLLPIYFHFWVFLVETGCCLDPSLLGFVSSVLSVTAPGLDLLQKWLKCSPPELGCLALVALFLKDLQF